MAIFSSYMFSNMLVVQESRTSKVNTPLVFKSKASIISSTPLLHVKQPSLTKVILGTTNSPDTPLYQNANKVLSVAFKRLGYKLAIETLPNKRSLFWANSGHIDGDLFRISELSLKEFPNLHKVSEALFTVDQSVLSKKEITINGWDSVKCYTIAYERGTKFIESNESIFKQAIQVNSTEQALDLVYSDKADLTITSFSTASKFLNKNKKYQKVIKILQPPLVSITLHTYINKKRHPELANALSLQLKAMKESGELQRLMLTE